MPPSANLNPGEAVPLCVDLDGTLIKTDLLWEHLARLLRRNPVMIFRVLIWWLRGRAKLKQQLARRVKVDPATLPYHAEFLAWLKEQKAAGRKLVLATASDLQMALPVAEHVGLFDEVLGSDGKVNLRSGNKLKVLTEKFGPKGFDYAGNSTADYAVWRGSRQAIVVNASRAVLNKAAKCTSLGPVFCEHYSAHQIGKRFAKELLIDSGYLAAAGAGLILAEAFPKNGVPGLAWIAPALILLSARRKRGLDAARVGYVAGLAAALGSFSWLLLIPVTGFPIVGWLALGAYLAVYTGVWTWLVSYDESPGAPADSWHRRTAWAITGAAAWTALEMIQARLFGGLPWNLLGSSQYQMIPLIQIASVTGIYGVSFIVVWSSLSLYSAGRMILARPSMRFAWQGEIALPLFAVAFLFAWGTFCVMPSASDSKSVTISAKLPSLRVTLVQPSIPQTFIWSGTNDSLMLNQVVNLSREGLKNDTDLLIWPEAALNEMVRYDGPTYNAVTGLAASNHVWMIIGSDDEEPPANGSTNAEDALSFNSSFLVSPTGELADVYHKRHLVAFGEYIPLSWIPIVKWFTPITGSYTPGTRPVEFSLPNLKVHTAVLICFEDVFPDPTREYAGDNVDFLVNITNDGWFRNGSAQWQQAAAACFRSVENGLPLVRCANNGLTCWIDKHGHLRDIFKDTQGTVYGPGTTTVEIPLLAAGEKRIPTYYHEHGDIFGWSCVGLTALLAANKMRSRRSKST